MATSNSQMAASPYTIYQPTTQTITQTGTMTLTTTTSVYNPASPSLVTSISFNDTDIMAAGGASIANINLSTVGGTGMIGVTIASTPTALSTTEILPTLSVLYPIYPNASASASATTTFSNLAHTVLPPVTSTSPAASESEAKTTHTNYLTTSVNSGASTTGSSAATSTTSAVQTGGASKVQARKGSKGGSVIALLLGVSVLMGFF